MNHPVQTPIAPNVLSDVPSRHLIRVAAAPCNYPALSNGDILLQYRNTLITKLSDLHGLRQESLSLRILRDGIKKQVDTPTVPLSKYLVTRVVWFCGARLEPPHSLISYTARELFSGVFNFFNEVGSPAQMFGLPVCWFITHTNGEETKDFDKLIRVIRLLPADEYYQITCASLQGATKTVSVWPDTRDFRTLTAKEDRDNRSWKFEELWQRAHNLSPRPYSLLNDR